MNVRVKGCERTVRGKNVASLACSGVPCTLFSLVVFNTSAGTLYIQCFDAVALPVDGTVPDEVFPVPSLSSAYLEVGTGKMFDTGLVVCSSSTPGTKTIGGANCFFSAEVAGQ